MTDEPNQTGDHDNHVSPLDAIRHVDVSGNECWSAREFAEAIVSLSSVLEFGTRVAHVGCFARQSLISRLLAPGETPHPLVSYYSGQSIDKAI